MKHPVQIFAITAALVSLGWVAFKYPQVILPVLACCVLAAAMLACACAFAGRKRNRDDNP